MYKRKAQKIIDSIYLNLPYSIREVTQAIAKLCPAIFESVKNK